MEKLYRKKENGRYEEATMGYNHELSDGIWLVQNKPTSTRVSSLFWKVGDLKRVADVTTHAALQAIEDDLIKYLQALQQEDSQEYLEAKEISGGYLRGPIGYTNISASDLCTLLLREIAKKIEKQ